MVNYLTPIRKINLYKKFKKLSNLFDASLKLNQNAKSHKDISMIECPYCKDDIAYCNCRVNTATAILEKYGDAIFIEQNHENSNETQLEKVIKNPQNSNVIKLSQILKSLGIKFKSKTNPSTKLRREFAKSQKEILKSKQK